MKSAVNKFGKVALTALLIAFASGCASRAADSLNPFQENSGTEELGDRNSSALMDEVGLSSKGGHAEKARHALETMGTYRSAQAPEPTYPVLQPAEVRLMWVPDHLNRTGDLVPAHYYYLKVLHDRWAVQDAFDLERQLNEGSSTSSSAIPWQNAQ